MGRFKRSLATRPAVVFTAQAPSKVAKSTVLNEGFALPGKLILPTHSEILPDPPTREGPEALPYGRGSGGAALAFASDPIRCQNALLKEAYASTSLGPIESRIKKWDALARRAGFHDPFTLTPELIYAVMGALKLAGYRSAEQYLEAAKLEYFNGGGIWTDQLRLAARSAVRSCKRGIGCAKQAKGLPLLELGHIDQANSLVPQCPIHPGRAETLASWWLLREIEASQAKVKHVSVDRAHLRIDWRLPSSKADWKALGAVRSHKCACNFMPWAACPYHAMFDHLQVIGQDPETPVFPTSQGTPASKQGWADTFQALAKLLQLPACNPSKWCKMLDWPYGPCFRRTTYGLSQCWTLAHTVFWALGQLSLLGLHPRCTNQTVGLLGRGKHRSAL